jgi:hypothetical protein
MLSEEDKKWFAEQLDALARRIKADTRQEFAALGGNARAKKLTEERRKEIASGAASARWKDRQE